MQKWILGTLLLAAPLSYAQVSTSVTSPTETTTSVQWVSKDSNDPVTIANGTGLALTIQIMVNASPNKVGGIDVKNCGDTSHVDAGSSAICSTNDASNPVSFASESATEPASGTYTVSKK